MKINFLAFIMISSSLYAAQTARVLMVRGDVTQLSPGSKEAKKVKKGDVYKEDTSVLTGEKSVVRLKFADKSVMNLGPKSKVVVSKMPKKKPNMISLITGSIKAEVEKKNTGKTKMIVKTKSAVMGIRGTKFQAIYNSQNNNTSLVTVEGKVAMVKKEAVQKKLVKEEVVQKELAPDEMLDVTEPAQEEVVQKVVSADEELDALDKAFEEIPKEEIVEVDAGKFAGVQEAAAKPTVPIKIAPVQYEALAKSMGSDKKAEDVMETTDAKEEIKNLEKLKDSGEVVQKPGGYIDFETGLYVPPSEDAKLNKETGTFEVEEAVGKVDQETGDYIPPKGVKLDAKKGFVVDQKELAKVASKEEVAATLALVKERNEEVKKQVVVNKMETKSSSGSPKTKKKSKVAFDFIPFSEVLTLKIGDGGDSEFLSEQAFDVVLSYEREWSETWKTNFKLGFVTYEFQQDSEANYFKRNGEDEDMILAFDTHQKLTERWTITYELLNRAYYFSYPNDNGEVVEQGVELASLNLGGIYSWRTWKDIKLDIGGKFLLFIPEEIELTDRSSEELSGGGINLFINGNYQFSNKINFKANLFMQNITHELSDSDGEFERFTLGSGFNVNYAL